MCRGNRLLRAPASSACTGGDAAVQSVILAPQRQSRLVEIKYQYELRSCDHHMR